MISFLVGLIGAVVGLVGWFGRHSVPLLFLGTVLYVVETFMTSEELNGAAKLLDFIIFGIGCVVAAFIKVPWYVGGMLAINIYSAITILLGIPYTIALLFGSKK